MKTPKMVAAGALIALALAACTNGLKQDPMADQPDNVKNAKFEPKPAATPKNEADKSDYLRIQPNSDAYEFAEGKQNEAIIKGAILADINGHAPVLGQDYDVSIVNLADFPGATFDPSTGSFKWTPPPGFVDQNYTRNVRIQATIQTKFLPYRQTTQDIVAVVTRAEQDPTVVSIEDLTTKPTKEGDVRRFKVVVRDPHGDDAKPEYKPHLEIVSSGATGASATSLISCDGTDGCTNPTREKADPTLWDFTLVLDLSDATAANGHKEITKDQATLQFAVRAISRFGEASGLKPADVAVVTSIDDPVISWSEGDPLNVTAGQNNVVTFMVYDSGSNSNLTVNFDTRCDQVLGANSSCTCTGIGRDPNGPQLCTISWLVPAAPTQTDYDIVLSSLNQSKTDATQVKKTTFPPHQLHVIVPPKPVAIKILGGKK